MTPGVRPGEEMIAGGILEPARILGLCSPELFPKWVPRNPILRGSLHGRVPWAGGFEKGGKWGSPLWPFAPCSSQGRLCEASEGSCSELSATF